MFKKFLCTISFLAFLDISLNAQELAATVTIQSSKVDNQVDAKIFPQLQAQLKDFINQRKWSNDAFSNEEKIECSFYITIESVVSPGVYEAKLDRKSTRLNSSHSQQSRMPSSA